MKSYSWQYILQLLGKEGEHIIVDLLLDCSLFTVIEDSTESYEQLTGTLSMQTTR